METISKIPLIYSFVKVAQDKSFSKAASKMGVSRSHMSKQIKELEDQLQSSLFYRSTRSVELTDFGTHFYNLCQNHVVEIERIAEQSRKFQNIPEGRLKITLAGAFGEEVVSPVLTRLLLRYPKLSFELQFNEKVLDLDKEEIDLAIRVSSNQPKNSLCTKVGARKEFVCASPSYLARCGEPKSPKDLRHHNCLIGARDTWSFKTETSHRNYKIRGNYKSNSGRSLVRAALGGLGIVKLPSFYLEDHFRDNTLVPILRDHELSPVYIWAIPNRRNRNNQTLRMIIEELQKERF